MNDKDVKSEFKKRASKDYSKYYAVDVLKKEGFERKKCKCGTWFWTTTNQEHCGDASCSGGFSFFGKSPAKNKMDYIETWKEFSKLFKKWGYTPIDRYPVAARWRKDTDFVQASIYDFQPYVVSGEVKPPANPLVVPQFCLRFNDIDNVGITGAHYTGFVMIGQHAFNNEKEWNQEKYFTDIHNWLVQGLKLPKEEITYHEDAWAGGGNFGPCMEFFSRGLELGNQVYMMYEKTPKGEKELNLKVLDMGMGHERNAWFTQGKSTSYETTFPSVCKKMFSLSGIKVNKDLMEKFLPYSSYLNIDEVDDINKTWKIVGKNVGMDVKELKKEIIPLSGLFSVAEHSRSLLVALSDGSLPSNVGGGYNLRVILRRALSFIDKYGWNVNLNDLCNWHATYLKPLFPELSENLENVKKILDVEKKKYNSTRENTSRIVSRLKEVNENKLIELYDSNGISPELVKEEYEKQGKKLNIPEDFYRKVAERQEEREQIHSTQKEEKLELIGIQDTKALYYDDYLTLENFGNVLKIIDNDVILDKTVAYPTSGGQLKDKAEVNGQETLDIFKQGNVIVHRLKEKPNFKEGNKVKVKIDEDYRKQLAQHHTATHIIGASAKKVLGGHINQAGAKKTMEKAHLDITHYENVSSSDLKNIEKEANSIIASHIKINKSFLNRSDAEKKYGMQIYQGGAVPGKEIRIVEIVGEDVQACGGTHLNNTKEAEEIRILKSSKIQDGIVRIEFTAGKAALQKGEGDEKVLSELAKLLKCNIKQIPGRCEELFKKWKKIVKKKKEEDPTLTSKEEYNGDILVRSSQILKTQPEHLIKTVKRFKEDIKKKLELIP